MRRQEVKDVQKTIAEYLTKNNYSDVPNGNTPSPLSPTNSVGSQGSGSNTPPCPPVPLPVHSAFQRQDTFFSYLVMCHELWDVADANVFKGNHTGKAAHTFRFNFLRAVCVGGSRTKLHFLLLSRILYRFRP